LDFYRFIHPIKERMEMNTMKRKTATRPIKYAIALSDGILYRKRISNSPMSHGSLH